MEMKLVFTLCAILVATASYAPYLRDILSRKTRPHIYTWIIFTLINTITTSILLNHGGGVGAYALLFSTLLNGAVLFLSFRLGTKNITTTDTILLFGCLVATIFWWRLEDPLIALLTVSAIRGVSYLPTIRKSFLRPWDETLITWTGFTFGNMFMILALDEYTVLTLTYIITMSVFNLAVVGICLIRRRVVPKS